MLESLLVVGIVVVAVVLGGRSLRKTLKGENGNCGCGGCSRCGSVDGEHSMNGHHNPCAHPEKEALDKPKGH